MACSVFDHVSRLCDLHEARLDELGFVHDLQEACVFEKGSKLALPYDHITQLLKEAEQKWRRLIATGNNVLSAAEPHPWPFIASLSALSHRASHCLTLRLNLIFASLSARTH